MKQILRELNQFKGALALTLLFVLANVFSTLALPAYLSTIINIGIVDNNIPLIIDIGGKMLIFVVLSTVTNIAIGYYSSKISMGVGRNLRSKIFRKVQSFSQAEIEKFQTSSLITRTNNDIIQIQNFINMTLRISLMAPIMCIGGIIMAFAKSTSMSLILLFSMPIMVTAVLIIGKRALPLSNKMQEKIDNINLVTREKLTGIRVSRAFGTEQHETEKFYKVNNDFMENSIKMNRIMGSLNPLLSLILYFTMVALLFLGGYKIIVGEQGILVGDIIAVMQYVMQIMMSVMLLAMVFIMYPRASVSSKRITEVLETELTIIDVNNSTISNITHGSLEFKNVSFRYPGASEDAIHNISFTSNKGETTAIIGSTGCGKSTLINLIPRFFDVTKGEIKLNNVNIKEYSKKQLRSKIGYVPQKAFLFKGTIESNIKFGDESSSENRIIETSKIAQSFDFITSKDDGFKSEIAQGGRNVSGGQRQRLAIARAIVRKPEVYIFDDSFSALDFKTDAALRKSLSSETLNSTVILVAQRVSTIKNATRILVLESGHCVGQGTHDELMKNCEVYQEIVYSQLSKEEA
ncbi:MAG: ABC transporter ATP-binding protein [Clostridium sp.]